MAHILHLDSSARGDRSLSRTLSGEFVQAWKETHPDDTVTYRDIGQHPVPYVDEAWIAAAFSNPADYTPELAAAIQLSDELVDEFLAADRYVFGVPMYNLGVPAVFKAYVDQIVRGGKTFAVTDSGFQGLVPPGRKMLVVSARSGVYTPGTPAEAVDLNTSYLKTIFGFVGVGEVTVIPIEGLAYGDEYREKAVASAREALKTIAATW